MEFGTKEYYHLELLGLQILQQSGFVLVAGGLGERLGYNGIKVSLPVETLTMTSYLEFYIRKILSYQVHLPRSLSIQHRIPGNQSHRIPLAIMTSDSNHALYPLASSPSPSELSNSLRNTTTSAWTEIRSSS